MLFYNVNFKNNFMVIPQQKYPTFQSDYIERKKNQLGKKV